MVNFLFQTRKRYLNSLLYFSKRFYKNPHSSQGHKHEILHINTNVAKDVILFKYDSPKYFKLLNIFGITQFAFWIYLSNFAYTTLRDVPVTKDNNKDTAWWRKINLGEQKYRNTLTAVCCLLGYCFLIGAWMYTIRSVRYLVLRKGGNQISFVCYGPFGKNTIMDVPLSKISASESRELAKVQLPIKVEGKWLYYMLDMRGEFLNKPLFDVTAGLKRSFKGPVSMS